jgi:acetoin utilization protein AcuB
MLLVNMFVRHAMTTAVVTISPDANCREVLLRFRKQRFRRAPVIANGELVGIISEGDLLRAVPQRIADIDRRAGSDAQVREFMSSPAITISPDAHLEDAARLMLERRVGGLPVVEDGKLVGIVTESDVFRSFVRITSGVGDLRITLFDSRTDRRSLVGTEPAGLCVKLGLSLHTLLTHDTPGGAAMIVMWVSGARVDELSGLLELAGYRIVALERRAPCDVA